MKTNPDTKTEITFEDFKAEVINDYKLAVTSRECSLLGRREVLTGKAKFGIFGDGKEVPQIAWAKAFENGDFRSGYYRDQTFMMAIGELTIEQFFAGLYANTDLKEEPCSGGRQMNAHFSSRFLDESGEFTRQTTQYNSSSDISTTSGHIPRLIGLAQASKVYKQMPHLDEGHFFSNGGSEVIYGTIGDASTSQGLFWEGINAAGIMQIPMVLSIWDDGYGISVPSKYHHANDLRIRRTCSAINLKPDFVVNRDIHFSQPRTFEL